MMRRTKSQLYEKISTHTQDHQFHYETCFKNYDRNNLNQPRLSHLEKYNFCQFGNVVISRLMIEK